MNYNNNFINLMIENNKLIMSKADLMGFILKHIMEIISAREIDYMIICSYGLRKITQINDIDVIVTTDTFTKLKKLDFIVTGKSKITGDERLYLPLKLIDEEAEIEFFDGQKKGFPKDTQTVNYYHSGNLSEIDQFGNPCLNPIATAQFYSGSCIFNNKILFNNNIQISRDRLAKNIDHLIKLAKYYSEYKFVIQPLLENEIIVLGKYSQ